MATVMNISVQITGSAAGLQKSVASANTSLNQLGASASKSGGLLSKLGSAGPLLKATVATSAIAATAAIVKMGIESEQVNAQTVAGLKSTGGAANVTLGEIQGLATEVQNYSGIGDEAVQTGQNMLLTFTGIRNEVGQGNDIFNQASVAVADMATKMNGGAIPAAEQMQATALQLGKALNDPATGLSKLTKVGVTFTEQQKAQVQAMVAAGNTAGAQKVILAELQKEFGGAAKAAGSTFIGQFSIMKETVFNILETLVVAIFKILQPIVAALTPVFQVIGQVAGVIATVLAGAFKLLTPLIQPVLIGLGAIAAVIVAALIPAIVASGIAFITAWAPVIAAGAVVVAVVAAIGAAVMGMVKLVQAGLSALSGGWSKMSGWMKAALIILAPLWLPIVAAIKLVQAALSFLWGVAKKVWAGIVAAAKPVVTFIGDFISGIAQIAGAIGKAAGAVGSWIAEFAKGIPIVSQVIDLVNVIGDTAEANAMAATADMRTLGLEVALAAQTSSAKIVEMGKSLAVLRQQLQAAGQGAQWTQMMNVGLDKLDQQLKDGTITASEAQKGYLAWGLSLQSAQNRANGITAALQKTNSTMTQSVQIGFKTADAMSSAWDKVGPKVAGSLNQIAKAITKSVTAEAKMAQNTTKVTNRLIQDYGLTEEQAQRSLADASPQAMATMARASDKDFKRVGTAIQKANHIIPTVGKNLEDTGKAASNATKGTDGLAKSTDKTSKSAQAGAKATTTMAKATEQTDKASKNATSGVSKLGSTVQSGQSKISGMTTQVSKLSSELNGLPKSIRIEVTVNVNKTGASVGGVVPGLARGGVTAMTSGLPLTMVGEHGPELAALPPGTRVFSHNDTSGMLRAAMDQVAGGRGGAQRISGELSLVNGRAYIEGVVLDTLDDGRVVDDILTRAMKRP